MDDPCDPDRTEEFEYLLTKSEDTLYFLLGTDGLSFAVAPNEKEWTGIGRKKLEKFIPDIRTALCIGWRACEKINKHEDNVQLASALSDVLTTVLTGVPITIISALFVKIGIKKFCHCP